MTKGREFVREFCNTFRTPLAVAAFVASTFSAAVGPAMANESYALQYASYISENAPQSRAFSWWADEVEKRTGGRVKVDLFFASSLLKATDMLRGVADGRAQIGYVANPYFPAELPLSSVAGVPFVTSNTEAQMRTFYELYDRNTAFRDEWQSNGVHVLFFNLLSANVIGSSQPITDLEGLENQSIRGVGYVNQVLDLLKANPVAIAAPEIYEALLRGTIDGYSGIPYGLIPALKLQEVAPHTLSLGTGTFAFTATAMDKDLWDEMPEDIQLILTEVSREYMDVAVEMFIEAESKVCAQIKEAGGKVRLLSEGDNTKLREVIGTQISDLWIEQTRRSGADSVAFFEDYTQTLARYDAEATYVPGAEVCASTN